LGKKCLERLAPPVFSVGRSPPFIPAGENTGGGTMCQPPLSGSILHATLLKSKGLSAANPLKSNPT
jgi:hypothetical protein